MKKTDTIRDRFSTSGGSLLIHTNYYAEGLYNRQTSTFSEREQERAIYIYIYIYIYI
jgi:hypothetical protein